MDGEGIYGPGILASAPPSRTENGVEPKIEGMVAMRDLAGETSGDIIAGGGSSSELQADNRFLPISATQRSISVSRSEEHTSELQSQ